VAEDNDVLDDVTAAILDGTAVDWNAAEASADPDAADLLKQLKTVAVLAELHRVAAAPGGQPPGPWMDLVRARTLEELLAGGRTFTPAEVTRIGAQLAGAIAAGSAHGDIKAQNVLLSDDGRAVLMDFTAAKAPTPTSDLQSLGALMKRLLAGSRTPPPLAAIVDRLLNPDPARRGSARALQVDLAALDQPASLKTRLRRLLGY
jgi:aminoglycoside phosphotransferase (APT) family kinase protein